MGRIIRPSEVKAQVQTMTATLEKNRELLLRVFAAVQAFSNENDLQGKAWTGMKDQIGAHDSVIHGMEYMIDGLIEVGTNLVAECGEEDLDEDVLETQLDGLKSYLRTIED